MNPTGSYFRYSVSYSRRDWRYLWLRWKRVTETRYV